MSLTSDVNIYYEILEEFLDSNIITTEQYFERDKVQNKKDIFLSLKKMNVNEIILTNKISEKFKIKKFSMDSLSDDNFIITENGVVFNEVYYLLNPFNNIIKKISENNKKYNSYFYKDTGIISLYNYNILKEKLKNNQKTIKNADKQLLEINTLEIIYNAIIRDCEEIIINKEYSHIQFKKFNNTFDTNFTNESEIIEVNDIISFDKVRYRVKTEKVSEKIFIIYITKYEEKENIFEVEKKYKEQIEKHLMSSNGLFLFSEKYETGYYYSFLEYMFKKNPDKKILSIESSTKNVIGVSQKNPEASDYNDIYNSDIIFIENIISEEQYNLLNYALILGKFVFASIKSQDSINALYTLLNMHKNIIDPKLISEKFITCYHITKLPKVCSNCSKDELLIDSQYKQDPQFSLLFTTNDNYKIGTKIANKEGCSHCDHGYNEKMIISELLDYEKDLAFHIEENYNIRIVKNMKNSKRWETVYDNSIIQLLKKNITLDDIKSKL